MNLQFFTEMLEQNPQLKDDLFTRGFLISDHVIEDQSGFPFYGNWKSQSHGKFFFTAHHLTGMHLCTDEKDNCFFLMGHAYNPVTMEYDEQSILNSLSQSYNTDAYWPYLNDLTGIFVYGTVIDGQISFLTDPTGMQSACCGKIGDTFYLSSHPQLVGDLCGLEMDAFVKELVSYKWYNRVKGPYLPADLTPFAELKRVVPNMEYRYDGTVSHKRFWPLTDLKTADTPEEYNAVIAEASELLHNNMELIAKKWEKPWISLTGGIDSNTTFAAANGLYDRFDTFSYISAEKEIPDAEAAKQIADHFGVKHHEYHIPSDETAIANYENTLEVLRHNNGYIAERRANESRKRLYLRQHAECGVEVKSWVSESIRAYWYKHFGRKRMPKLSAKLYRNLYKIFLDNRKLAHQVDALFKVYIREYAYDKIPKSHLTTDMYYHEIGMGSWGSLNISEMKYCFDITCPYNNRKLLDLLFRVPLKKRISDEHHMDMKKYLNRALYDMHIRVVNLEETNFRAFMLNIIFTLNSILPF